MDDTTADVISLILEGQPEVTEETPEEETIVSEQSEEDDADDAEETEEETEEADEAEEADEEDDAVQMFTVKVDGREQHVLIPVIDPFIERVDKPGRTIYLCAPEELYNL